MALWLGYWPHRPANGWRYVYGRRVRVRRALVQLDLPANFLSTPLRAVLRFTINAMFGQRSTTPAQQPTTTAPPSLILLPPTSHHRATDSARLRLQHALDERRGRTRQRSNPPLDEAGVVSQPAGLPSLHRRNVHVRDVPACMMIGRYLRSSRS
jgi:hypothetical protein